MYTKSTAFFSATILSLFSLPSVMAADCEAIGYMGDNSVYNQYGAPTISGYQGAKIYKNGEEIYHYEPCKTCSSLCSDYIGLDAHHTVLDETFGWAASCAFGDFQYVSAI